MVLRPSSNVELFVYRTETLFDISSTVETDLKLNKPAAHHFHDVQRSKMPYSANIIVLYALGSAHEKFDV